MLDSAFALAQRKRWLIGALGLAAVVRFYLLWQYYCISSDGVVYIRAAQDFLSGGIMAGLKSVYPPGYPLLIAAVYPLIGNWELAGQILSLFFGVAMLLPLYSLFRALSDEKVALLACYLAAISPFLALYSAHVRSEATYLFLAVLALYLFLTGIQRSSKAHFWWGGLVAGYAYLVRPEALGFLLIVPAVIFLRWLRRREAAFSWLMQTVGLLGVGFLLFAMPYIVYLSVDTGHFGAVSRKAGVTLGINLQKSGLLDDDDIARFGSAESLVFTEYIRQHPWRYAQKAAADLLPAIAAYFEALHYSYVPFLLIGLCLVFRDKVGERQDLLLLVFVFAHVFGFALILVKRRYALQAVPISLAWVAVGIYWAWDKIRLVLTPQRAKWVAVSLAVIFLGATLPKTLKSVSREKAFVRDTGWYLKSQNRRGNLKVATFDERVNFYAETATVPLAGVDETKVAAYLRAQKADYLAVESKALEKTFPEIYRAPERFGLALEKSFVGTRKDRMLLYKVS